MNQKLMFARSWISTALFAVFMPIVCPPPTTAQEEPADILKTMDSDLKHYWTAFSLVSTRTDQMGNHVPILGGYDNARGVTLLFSDRRTLKDLELTESQSKQLNELLKKIPQVNAKVFSLQLDNKNKEAEELIAQIDGEVNRAIDEILIQHQRIRLRQLMLRKYIRGVGPLHALTQSGLSSELKITKEQKKEIAQAAKNAFAENEKRIKKFRENYTRAVLNVLDADDRKTLRELLEHPLKAQRPEIDLLNKQLETFIDATKNAQQSKTSVKLPFGLNKQKIGGNLYHAVALRIVNRGESEIDIESTGFSVGKHGLNDPIDLMLTDKQVQKELEITKDQITSIHKKQKAFHERLWKRYAELNRSGTMPSEVQKILAQEFKADRAAVLATLTNHQLEWLENIKLHRTVRVFSLPWLLKLNAFEGIDPLTIDQTAELLKVCEKQLEFGQKLAKDIQDDVSAKLLRKLTSRQRKQLEDLMGEPAHFEYPWISRLQFQLQYGNQEFWNYHNTLHNLRFGPVLKITK